MGRRGTLSNHSILMSLLKDLQLPVLSLRRLLRSLLIYYPKRARNPQYALSLHSKHVRKPRYSSLLYPNHTRKPLCFHLLLYSLQASCRPINGS
jgi:hypothetical protein